MARDELSIPVSDLDLEQIGHLRTLLSGPYAPALASVIFLAHRRGWARGFVVGSALSVAVCLVAGWVLS